MRATHTPGPWHVSESQEADIESDFGMVARTMGHPNNQDEEGQANARLIAAAPDLLAALRDLVQRCDGAEGVRADGSNIQTIAAHAAIAKAEGST